MPRYFVIISYIVRNSSLVYYKQKLVAGKYENKRTNEQTTTTNKLLIVNDKGLIWYGFFKKKGLSAFHYFHHNSFIYGANLCENVSAHSPLFFSK